MTILAPSGTGARRILGPRRGTGDGTSGMARVVLCRWGWSSGEQGVEVGSGVPVGRFGHVSVELEGQAGGRVAEPMLNDPWVLAGADHEGGGGVAEAVE